MCVCSCVCVCVFVCVCVCVFVCVEQQPYLGLGRQLIVEVSRSHSDAPHSLGLGRRIGLSQRPLPDNMQHSQDTDFHVPGAIQGRNPRKRATAERVAVLLSHIVNTTVGSMHHGQRQSFFTGRDVRRGTFVKINKCSLISLIVRFKLILRLLLFLVSVSELNFLLLGSLTLSGWMTSRDIILLQ